MKCDGGFTLEEMITELERESRMRQRWYPNYVRDGRLTQPIADKQMALLQASIVLLAKIKKDWET